MAEDLIPSFLTPTSHFFLARGGLSLFADGLHVFTDSGSIVDHRVCAGAVRQFRESPTQLARTLAMITPVRCERYDVIGRGDVLARRTTKGASAPARC